MVEICLSNQLTDLPGWQLKTCI